MARLLQTSGAWRLLLGSASVLLSCSLFLSPFAVRGEVDGLILDRTLTRLGRDFFRQYVTRLGAEDGIPGFNLTVREKVTAQWGSIISIEANDEIIYRAPLRPRGDGHGEEAEQAATATAEFLLRSSESALQSDEEDISLDGL